MTVDAPAPGAPLILVNPRASRLQEAGKRDQIVEAVSAAVRRRTGRSPMIEAGSLAATRDALASATEAPLVVVVGGDGTVREAAAALADRETPLAIVPGGTGNVLAFDARIRGSAPRPTSSGPAGRAAWTSGWPAGGRLGRSDHPARWPRAVFTVACGMGLDARIMAAAEHEWKRHLKFGAYIGAAVREVVRSNRHGSGSWPTAT